MAVTYHGIRVRDEVFKGIQEALVLHQLGVDIMELGDTHGRCLAHIWILILQALPEWLTQVLSDLVNPNAAHGPHSQGPDERIGVLTVLRGSSHWPGARAGQVMGSFQFFLACSSEPVAEHHLVIAMGSSSTIVNSTQDKCHATDTNPCQKLCRSSAHSLF